LSHIFSLPRLSPHRAQHTRTRTRMPMAEGGASTGRKLAFTVQAATGEVRAERADGRACRFRACCFVRSLSRRPGRGGHKPCGLPSAMRGCGKNRCSLLAGPVLSDRENTHGPLLPVSTQTRSSLRSLSLRSRSLSLRSRSLSHRSSPAPLHHSTGPLPPGQRPGGPGGRHVWVAEPEVSVHERERASRKADKLGWVALGALIFSLPPLPCADVAPTRSSSF